MKLVNHGRDQTTRATALVFYLAKKTSGIMEDR